MRRISNQTRAANSRFAPANGMKAPGNKYAWMISGLLLTGVVSGTVVSAAPPVSTEPAGVSTTIQGYEGQTVAVLERAAKQYANLSSYQDQLHTTYEAQYEGSDQVELQNDENLSLSFERPNKLAMIAPDLKIITNGQKVWQYLIPLEQYIQDEFPQPPQMLIADKLPVASTPWYKPHPVTPILMGTVQSPEKLIGKVIRFTGTKPEKLGEQAGQAVSGIVQLPGMNEEVPAEVWFSDASGLIGEFRYDVTKLAQRSTSPQNPKRLTRYTLRFQFEQIKLNEPIPAERFAFQPTNLDEKVMAFRPLSADEMQQKLLGRTAPELVGNDLTGKPVRLAELRGKVVLLDFWATWCRPCVQALPKIQSLADKYAGKGVIIIGVNGDDDKTPQAIKKFVDETRVSYPQVVGKNQPNFNQYRVSGIPVLCLIGKNGTVQAIRSGFGPGEEIELAANIDKLLKGENLVAPISTRPMVSVP